MSVVEPCTADPATAEDEASTVHIVCCSEWTDLGPTMCGSAVDNPAPVIEGVDQDCVVCVDLYVNNPMLCPRFGTCTDGSDDQ